MTDDAPLPLPDGAADCFPADFVDFVEFVDFADLGASEGRDDGAVVERAGFGALAVVDEVGAGRRCWRRDWSAASTASVREDGVDRVAAPPAKSCPTFQVRLAGAAPATAEAPAAPAATTPTEAAAIPGRLRNAGPRVDATAPWRGA